MKKGFAITLFAGLALLSAGCQTENSRVLAKKLLMQCRENK